MNTFTHATHAHTCTHAHVRTRTHAHIRCKILANDPSSDLTPLPTHTLSVCDACSLPPAGPHPLVWQPPKPDAVDLLLDGVYLSSRQVQAQAQADALSPTIS